MDSAFPNSTGSANRHEANIVLPDRLATHNLPERAIVIALSHGGVSLVTVIAACKELAVLESRTKFCHSGLAALDVATRPVLVVDDGLATGSPKEAAVAVLRAFPVAAPGAVQRVGRMVDTTVCPLIPPGFSFRCSILRRFTQTSDEGAIRLLAS